MKVHISMRGLRNTELWGWGSRVRGTMTLRRVLREYGTYEWTDCIQFDHYYKTVVKWVSLTFRREFLSPSSDQVSAAASYSSEDHAFNFHRGVNVRPCPDHLLTIWLPVSRRRRSPVLLTIIRTAVVVMCPSGGGTLECVQAKPQVFLAWCMLCFHQVTSSWNLSASNIENGLCGSLLPVFRRFCGFRFLTSEILRHLILKDP